MSKSFKFITLIVIPLIVCVYILFFLPDLKPTEQSSVSDSFEQPSSESPATVFYDPNNSGELYIEAYTSDGIIASDTITINKSNVKIKTQNEIKFSKVPDNIKVPFYYSQLILPGVTAPVYSFENEDMSVCYRAWGSYCGFSNNIFIEKLEGYFPVNILKSNSSGYSIQAISGDTITDRSCLSSVTYETATPDHIPDHYYLLSDVPLVFTIFDTKMNQDFRTFIKVGDTVRCYPCDIHGSVSAGSLPVDAYIEDQYLAERYTASEIARVIQTEISYPFRTDNGLILTVIPPCGGSYD